MASTRFRISSLPLTLVLVIFSGLLAACGTDTDSNSHKLAMAALDEMPAEVKAAPVMVQQAYQFNAANPEIMKQIPCYCGCGSMGHTSNYSCYVSGTGSDGKISYDTHALGCSICVDITQDTMRLLDQGKIGARNQGLCRPDIRPVRLFQHALNRIQWKSMRESLRRWIPVWRWIVLAGLALLVLIIPTPASATEPIERTFRIEASQFSYSPAVLSVNPGDHVTIELVAKDVMHGLAIDGYKLKDDIRTGSNEPVDFHRKSAGFISLSLQRDLRQYAPIHDWQAPGRTEHHALARHAAGRVGARRRCVGGAEMSKLQYAVWKEEDFKLERELSNPERIKHPERIDLNHIPWIRPLLQSRWPQFLLRALTLAGFVFTIAAGLIRLAGGQP